MKNKKNIILVGGGGHCKACIDVIEQTNNFNILGVIDISEKVGQSILGYKIIGTDNDVPKLIKSYTKYIFITIGHIKNPAIRINLFKRIKNLGGVLPTIVSPNAYVSKHSIIGEGTIIMHKCVINTDVYIGNNTIINNQALIEHDTIIGNHTHISTGARINGGCKIGDECFIGSGSIVNQGVNIDNNVLVGSGSLVRKDINCKGIYIGNPLKRL